MTECDVFISYHTDSSRHITEAICNSLESNGVRCWYAPRDTRGAYAKSIAAAIKECKIFILVLNRESSFSEDVLSEINLAVERVRRGEAVEILPFQISAEEISDAARYYIGRMHWIDAITPPIEKRIKELTERVLLEIGKPPRRTVVIKTEGDSAGREYTITQKVEYPDTGFVCRKKEIEALRQQMSSYVNKMLLWGMGGIGKSEIVKKYISENHSDYDIVKWVVFDGSIERTVANDAAFTIEGISRADYHEDTDREYYERKLKILQKIADRDGCSFE